MKSDGYVRLINAGQVAAMIVISAGAMGGVVATTLAIAGILPWIDLSARFGSTEVGAFGLYLQVGVTLLLLMLTQFLPSARRVLQLENSHRDFQVGMEDVTRAYRMALDADQEGAFELEREFDAVRERFHYLRNLPDLAEIDAELLTMAAQMSEQSRDLAKVFSGAKVARAKEALKQRKADAEALEARIQEAHTATRDLKRMMEDVDVEESAVAAQLQRLREEVVDMGLFKEAEFVRRGGGRHLKSVAAE